MRRREFIAGIASAAPWPLTARAQQPTMPVIGYLSNASANLDPQVPWRSEFVGFRRGPQSRGDLPVG